MADPYFLVSKYPDENNPTDIAFTPVNKKTIPKDYLWFKSDVEAFIATEFSTEMAVFQLPLLWVTAAIASGPFLDHLALIFRDSPLKHEYRVIDIEHDMYLFIDFDLQGLRTEFIVLLRKLIPLRFGQVFEMLEFRVAWAESD